MTRPCIIIMLSFLSFNSVYGQTRKVSCDCPQTQYAGTKADTTFYLSNGKTIVLCGYKNPDNRQTTFSEFVLSSCGQDTIIGFWGAVVTCKLSVQKDTLLVDRLEDLPIGKNFKYQEAVWTTEKIYFSGQKIIRKLVVNRQIKKYNQNEIQIILNTYETAKPRLNDSIMQLANELFIATISGNKKARQYFKEFKSKFRILDGAFSEEYRDLTSMLEVWDKKE